jgi:hypothetical protein
MEELERNPLDDFANWAHPLLTSGRQRHFPLEASGELAFCELTLFGVRHAVRNLA